MKLRSFFLCVFSVLSLVSTSAQSILTTAGGYSSRGVGSLSWTIGEVVIESRAGGAFLLTQGFQQPILPGAACDIQPNLTATRTGCEETGASATVAPEGGTGVYSVQWNIGGQLITGPAVDNLPMGAYSVTVDDGACVVSVDFVITFAGTPQIEWEKNLGGNEKEQGRAIRRAADGGFILGGMTRSSASGDVGSVNQGETDIWIIKLDSEGRIQWEKTYGGEAAEDVRAICPTADGGYLVAGSSSSTQSYVWGNHGGEDVYLLRLDAQGDTLWTRSYGGSDDEGARAVLEAADGSIIVGGWSRSADGDVGENNGLQDYWLLKLTAKGNIRWSRVYGGVGADLACCVDADGDGGYVLAGHSASFPGKSIDAWLIRTDGRGKALWSANYGGSRVDEANALAVVPGEGFLLAGESRSADGDDVTGNQGLEDLWLLRVNADGQRLWARNYGGSNSDIARAVRREADGGFLVAGWTASRDGDVGDLNGVSDYWIHRFDSQGSRIWSETFGGSSFEEAWAVDLAADGGVAVAGTTGSADGDVGGNNGEEDIWVLKLGCPMSTGSRRLTDAAPQFRVFPNPSAGSFTVRLEGAASLPAELRVAGPQGQTVFREQIPTGAALGKNIDLQALPRGVYVVILSTADGTISRKIILQ